jgi:hypothetical protein
MIMVSSLQNDHIITGANHQGLTGRLTSKGNNQHNRAAFFHKKVSTAVMHSKKYILLIVVK